jgi:hypothetical protein
MPRTCGAFSFTGSPLQSPAPGDVSSPGRTINLIKLHKGENEMEKIIEMWLNPINLGILFLCLTIGIWILAHSDPTRRDK